MRSKLFPALLISMAVALPAPPAQGQWPGGFLEKATGTTARPTLTPAQIQAFVPSRGKFAFPAPYGTAGIRITSAGDCGGQDCVNYIGYSYWRNINNHAGSDTMLIFLTLDRSRGGTGPTLFGIDKLTDAVSNLGPLFDATSPLSWATGEGWYWSATQPTTLYLNSGPRLLRYDVSSRQLQTVFDVTARYGSDKIIWQVHSSNDDRVHSATLRENVNWEMLGCVVYREDTGQFFYYPKQGDFDEAQIDKSGRWLLIKENVDGVAGEDNRIIDLTTGGETRFLDQNGAAGHSDNGFGCMVASDNWNNLPGAVRLWHFDQPMVAGPSQGVLVYRTTDWRTDVGHISYANAAPGSAPGRAYVAGSNASRINLPRSNEIICFPLDGSLDVLVVAPVMTSLDAAGGGDDYAKLPKGNLDVTGQYFIWTSNLGGGRLDAFLVKVPAHLLTGVVPPPDPCTRSSPDLTISPTQGSPASAGTSQSFTVNVTSRDSGACAAQSFDLKATAPAGWTAVLGAPRLTINPGASASTTLTVTSASSAADGVYPVTVEAVNSTAGALKTSTGVTCTIANPPGGASFADDFNRPDSTILGNGWLEAGGDFKVISAQLQNAAMAANQLAILPALSGATQMAGADFASANNNLGPNFCLLLRYQDPKNHYKLYRSIGGSSALRISRVVGGVEKILKSVSLPNPQKDVFFRLEGRAEGTRLSMSLNGVEKVVITDATFTSGAIGLLIVNGRTSHRIDNFAASAD